MLLLECHATRQLHREVLRKHTLAPIVPPPLVAWYLAERPVLQVRQRCRREELDLVGCYGLGSRSRVSMPYCVMNAAQHALQALGEVLRSKLHWHPVLDASLYVCMRTRVHISICDGPSHDAPGALRRVPRQVCKEWNMVVQRGPACRPPSDRRPTFSPARDPQTAA